MPKALLTEIKAKMTMSRLRSQRRGHAFGSETSRSGERATRATFWWGQARAQSRQKTQSMLLVICGANSSVPQPDTCGLPLMHSLPTQVRQMSGLLTVICSGEMVELAKLKVPRGQTYLQKGDSANSASNTKEETK